MDIFTLRIHMYNIIDGIVGIKYNYLKEEGYQFQSLLEAWQRMVLYGGRELRRQRGDIREMSFMAVLLGDIIWPPTTLPM